MDRAGLLGDLVYMTAGYLEMGILQTYEMDFDTAGEKDFEIKCNDYVAENDWYWFVDGTELGGRIDKIANNTSEKSITYTGRNWRGMLASKYILTGKNKGAVGASGDISDEINRRLRTAKMDELFVCDPPDAEDAEDTDVSGYDYPTNCTMYDGFVLMAREIQLKLLFRFSAADHRVHIIPTLENDYSDYLTYCSDNAVEFNISRSSGAVNHVIAYGAGDDGKNRVIHIFTDELGNIQPYATVANPTKDAHYITNTSKQVLTGTDEVQLVINASGAAKENYELLTSKPKDWNTNYEKYYKIDEPDEGMQESSDDEEEEIQYSSVEGIETETYTVLTTKPSDWAKNYSSYYVAGSLDPGDYTEVSAGSTDTTYALVKRKPKNWNTTYTYYYKRIAVADTYTYESYEAKVKHKKVKLAKKPADWAKNCTNYYKKQKGKWVKVKKIKHVKKDHDGKYKKGPKKGQWKWKISKTWYTAPKWKKNKFFKDVTTEHVPGFGSQGNVYKVKKVTSKAPAFVANNFYKRTESVEAPKWEKGMFYRQVIDNYAGMVEEAIQNLRESAEQDSQSVVLEGFDVTVGDYVGGTDDITGFDLCERVTNIIIKYTSGLQTEIEYEIGGESEVTVVSDEDEE